jgi:uncharacterized protein
MLAAGSSTLGDKPKVLPSTTLIRTTTEFINSLLAVPGFEMPPLGREWPTLRELASAHNLSANVLTDAF